MRRRVLSLIIIVALVCLPPLAAASGATNWGLMVHGGTCGATKFYSPSPPEHAFDGDYTYHEDTRWSSGDWAKHSVWRQWPSPKQIRCIGIYWDHVRSQSRDWEIYYRDPVSEEEVLLHSGSWSGPGPVRMLFACNIVTDRVRIALDEGRDWTGVSELEMWDRWPDILTEDLVMIAPADGPVLQATLGHGTVTLNWVGGAPPYSIYRDGVWLATVEGYQYVDESVPAGTSIRYDCIDSGGLFDFAVILTLPAAPTVSATEITETSIRLSWATVQSATSYNVYRDGVLIGTTASNQWYDRNLSPDYEFDYAVTAVNASGEGPADALTVRTAPQPPPPDAPTGLKLVHRTATTLTVEWDPVADVAGYRIYVNGSLSTQTSGTSVTVTGLSAGTQYAIAVQAYTGIYDGEISDTLYATTLGPPGPILHLNATPGPVTVYLTWAAPIGEMVTDYVVYVDGEMRGVATQTSYTVLGLMVDTQYLIGVSARNEAGEGPVTTVLVYTTPMTVPPSVTGLSAVATVRTISVQWDPSPGAIGYRVLCDGSLAADVSGLQTQTQITGLLPNTTYEITVMATNEAGTSTPSSVTATTKDGRPRILKVSPLGTGYVVTYTGPAGLDAPDEYRIYADDQLRHTASFPSQFPDADMEWTTGSVHTIRIDAFYESVICSDSKQITAYVAAEPVEYPPPTSIFENILQDWSSLILLVVAFSVVWTTWDWWRGLFRHDL